jgi:hypothetical protein
MPARTPHLNFVIGTLLCFVASTHAQSRFEEDFDDAEKSWQEVAVQLPGAPKQENLLPFYVSPAATQEFEIDLNSVKLGEDGVVRYVLVATSPSGVKNISFEGIRCATDERKLYAFGRPDGTWSRSRRDRWEQITSTIPNRQHAALAYDYFCENLTVAGNAQEMVERIRHQRPLRSTQRQ